MLPGAASSVFLAHIRANLECNGTSVYKMADTAQTYNIVLAVPDGLQGFVEMALDEFIRQFHPELIYPDIASGNNGGLPLFNYSVAVLNPDTVSLEQMIESQNASTGMLLAPTWMTNLLKNRSEDVIFPWLGVAMVVRINWCAATSTATNCTWPFNVGTFNLTALVLSDIFELRITYWNDSAIQSLNPNYQMPFAPIYPIPPQQGPWRDASADTLLQASGRLRFEYSTVYFDPISYAAQQSALYSTQYSVTLIAGTSNSAFDNDATTVCFFLFFFTKKRVCNATN